MTRNSFRAVGFKRTSMQTARARTVRALLFFALLFAARRTATAAEPFVFAVMGDVPYSEEEYGLLEKQLKELPSKTQFVFHVGDIKPGVLPCVESTYIRVAALLRESKKPVFILPGDNEWNDCVVPTPKTAWSYWEKHFLKFDSHWKHGLAVQRQRIRPENLAFIHNRVLFVGVNLVGGRVHDKDEWKLRQMQNVLWLGEQFKLAASKVDSAVVLGHAFPKNKDRERFEDGLLDVSEDFDRTILYIHGDGHTWIHDHPWKKHKNIERIQVDQGGKAPPLLVTATQEKDDPFDFDRRKKK